MGVGTATVERVGRRGLCGEHIEVHLGLNEVKPWATHGSEGRTILVRRLPKPTGLEHMLTDFHIWTTGQLISPLILLPSSHRLPTLTGL
jgi:hypothetical protein